jgi:hypothetical protein
MAKSSALAALDAAIKHSQTNTPQRSWFSRLPKEAQQDFSEIKSRYAAGQYRSVSVAIIHRAAIARCKEQGWPEPKCVGTIRDWLNS